MPSELPAATSAMTSMTRKTMAAKSANHQYAERDARPW